MVVESVRTRSSEPSAAMVEMLLTSLPSAVHVKAIRPSGLEDGAGVDAALRCADGGAVCAPPVAPGVLAGAGAAAPPVAAGVPPQATATQAMVSDSTHRCPIVGDWRAIFP